MSLSLIQNFHSSFRKTAFLAIQQTRNYMKLPNIFEKNEEQTKFDFTQTNYKKIDEILRKYPTDKKSSAIIPLLHLVQEQEGWVSRAAMNKVSNIVCCPPTQVYEVATFYTMFNKKPIGKHHIEVCTCTPCMLRGGNDILRTLEDKLGIDCGNTTTDGKFQLSEVECQGACANAPVIVIDGQFYEDLKTDDVLKIVEQVGQGKQPKSGPQSSRKASEPVNGKTTLKGKPTGPVAKDDL
ncbi:NADH dehydrogenase ubiquinone flavoprotein 2 [Anaeramoeba ignava]|uniref:NADH dehydrogenase ubiquinone flavoprotein 2 n=1 Tax=Anaeramoeba ignava TaxID=1746090 RepID=A0A9Q0R7A9_ANAIG|nr:NADH dehydrogenase ubiquinone flavoprotein 2 [Anaeramoeba ignava]